jgi:molybdopterin-containing oxidoreductase family membrane subunit
MVLTLALPIRAFYGLKDFITDKHLDNMAKVLLATGLMVTYGYAAEFFVAWYSGSPYEAYMITNRLHGPYNYLYASLILCNCTIPNLMWIKSMRTNVWALFFVAMSVNVGMWLERFVIVVTSLANDFVPSSWAHYSPTRWDFMLYAGTFGLFLTAFLLFLRFVPMISIFEVKTLLPQAKVKAEH